MLSYSCNILGRRNILYYLLYFAQEDAGGGQGRNTEKKRKKKSIFAQQFSRKACDESENMTVVDDIPTCNVAAGSCLGNGTSWPSIMCWFICTVLT